MRRVTMFLEAMRRGPRDYVEYTSTQQRFYFNRGESMRQRRVSFGLRKLAKIVRNEHAEMEVYIRKVDNKLFADKAPIAKIEASGENIAISWSNKATENQQQSGDRGNVLG